MGIVATFRVSVALLKQLLPSYGLSSLSEEEKKRAVVRAISLAIELKLTPAVPDAADDAAECERINCSLADALARPLGMIGHQHGFSAGSACRRLLIALERSGRVPAVAAEVARQTALANAAEAEINAAKAIEDAKRITESDVTGKLIHSTDSAELFEVQQLGRFWKRKSLKLNVNDPTLPQWIAEAIDAFECASIKILEETEKGGLRVSFTAEGAGRYWNEKKLERVQVWIYKGAVFQKNGKPHVALNVLNEKLADKKAFAKSKTKRPSQITWAVVPAPEKISLKQVRDYLAQLSHEKSITAAV